MKSNTLQVVHQGNCYIDTFYFYNILDKMISPNDGLKVATSVKVNEDHNW
jgi:hypothetical protein